LSGLNVNGILLFVYTIAGFFSGLASIVLISRLTSAQSNMGSGFELDAIAAVVIGGTSLSGGEGSVLGSLIGAALMGVIKNALILLGVNVYWQSVVIGLVIVLAVSIDAFRKNQNDLNLKKIGININKHFLEIRNSKKKQITALFVILLIAVIAIGFSEIFGGQRENGETQESQAALAPTTIPMEIDPSREFIMGEEILVCDNKLFIESVKIEEDDKSNLLIVEMQITNNSEKQVPINSFDFTAVGNDGKIFTDCAIGRTSNPLSSDRLENNDSIKGEVAFKIQEFYQDITLIWQPGWCTEVAYVDLTN